MDDAEEVYVNRTAISSRIVQLGLGKGKNDEAMEILLLAMRNITEREKHSKRAVVVWGAKMNIGDIRKAFENIEKMPITSFKPIYR